MDLDRVCNTCKLVKFHGLDLIDFNIEYEKLAQESCPKCKIVVMSNNHNFQYSDSTKYLCLKKQTTFFHSNETILKDDIENESKCSNSKNLLIVGSGLIRRLTFLKYLRLNLNKSINIIGLIKLEDWSYWSPYYFDHVIYAEDELLEEKEKTIDKIKEYTKINGIKIDGVLTYFEDNILMAIYIANYFNLPSIPFDYAIKIKNKYEMRKLSLELDINCPKFFFIYSFDRYNYINILRAIEDDKKEILISFDKKHVLSFPVVIKNPSAGGKSFVYKCVDNIDMIKYIEKSLDIKMDLLIEEYFDGHEIDVDLLIQNNEVKYMCIVDNFPPTEPNFLENGNLAPCIELDEIEKLSIKNIIIKWLNKMNFQNTCLHFELRCRPKSWSKNTKRLFDNITGELLNEKEFLMPIEINLRSGGAETWSMLKGGYQIDIIQQHINIALGIQLGSFKSNQNIQCISKDWYALKDGIIKSFIIDLEKIQTNRNIIEIVLVNSIESIINDKNKKYLGWLSLKCENSNKKTCQESMNQVLNCFDYKID